MWSNLVCNVTGIFIKLYAVILFLCDMICKYRSICHNIHLRKLHRTPRNTIVCWFSQTPLTMTNELPKLEYSVHGTKCPLCHHGLMINKVSKSAQLYVSGCGVRCGDEEKSGDGRTYLFETSFMHTITEVKGETKRNETRNKIKQHATKQQ